MFATESNFQLFIAIIGTISVILAAFLSFYTQRKAIELAKREIAQAKSRVEAQPEKAKPAWDLARVTLESYFNRNLFQIASIFWLSVAVMIVGFGIIIWGISHAIQSQNSIVPATIAGIAGVITEFIGATFLFIYRSTIQQALDYSRTLERINSVGMAMQILDTMPDKTESNDLKNRTKATLVELLIRQAHEIHENSHNEKREKSEIKNLN